MALATELRSFVVPDVVPSGRLLGEGSYGSVEEAVIPGATCVIKKLHEALLPAPSEAPGADRMANIFVAECRMMSTLRHPHIVQFLGVCFLPGSRLPALVMEKLMTDLHNFLEQNPGIPFTMKHSILEDVAKGLTFLHSRDPPIIHRDLTARNVLLNSAMVAKIADLGNSRIIDVRPGQDVKLTKTPGNMYYMPPEALHHNPRYNTGIDVFSFGVLSLFTLTQQFPNVKPATFTTSTGTVIGLSEVERRADSLKQLYGDLGRDLPLVRLVEQCLQNLPLKRPPITEVLRRLELVGEELQDHDLYDQTTYLNKLELITLRKREIEQQKVLTREMKQREVGLKAELLEKEEEIEGLLKHINSLELAKEAPPPPLPPKKPDVHTPLAQAYAQLEFVHPNKNELRALFRNPRSPLPEVDSHQYVNLSPETHEYENTPPDPHKCEPVSLPETHDYESILSDPDDYEAISPEPHEYVNIAPGAAVASSSVEAHEYGNLTLDVAKVLREHSNGDQPMYQNLTLGQHHRYKVPTKK